MTPDFWFGFGCAVVSQVGLCAAAVGVAIYYAEGDPYLSEFEDGDPEFCPYCYHELPAKPRAEDPLSEDRND